MITVLADMPPGVIGFELTGRLAKADYTDTVQPALAAAAADGGALRVVLVVPEAFDGVEPAAVWQDFKTGMSEWRAWERIALVTDVGWIRDGLRLFAWAVPGEVAEFPVAERDRAVAWAAATD